MSCYFDTGITEKVNTDIVEQKQRIENKKFLNSILKKDNITDRILEWKKGFRTGTTDSFFAEYIIMSEMGWTLHDIDETSEFDLLMLQKLLQTKNSVEKIESMKCKNSQI